MPYAAEVVRSRKANRTATARHFNAWKDRKWKPIERGKFPDGVAEEKNQDTHFGPGGIWSPCPCSLIL
jgi:hypothetical protein